MSFFNVQKLCIFTEPEQPLCQFPSKTNFRMVNTRTHNTRATKFLGRKSLNSKSRRSSRSALLVTEFQMFTCQIPAFFIHSALLESAQSSAFRIFHCDARSRRVERTKFKFVFFHRNTRELSHPHT